jgi:hypothetical protein
MDPRAAWARLSGLLRPAPLGGLVLLAAVLAALQLTFPDGFPLTAMVLPLLLGSLFLGPRQLPWFVIYVLALIVVGLLRIETLTARIIGGVAVMYVAGLIIMLTSFRRTRLGVAGTLGESMLVDLRDRIQQQGRVPRLPSGWVAESAIRSAGGTPFAGDFIVTAMPEFTHRLEVAVVDVSGKGEAAGTRALLLSGAFGGLLGRVAPVDFLPAANDYLLRQEWDEGFATAVHLAVDLRTGSFEVRSAGHPPAAHRIAGTGRWKTYDGEGAALGLLEGVEFPPVIGMLRPGDVLMLYTDGLVETRTRDISLGIDRMLGQAEPILHDSQEGSADRLVAALGGRADDRAIVVLRRT